MCSGIIVPLREIGLLPDGYGINSPCSKILWNEEDIVLVYCPENDTAFSNYAVSYSPFGNRKPLYVALIQLFSAGGLLYPQGNIWQCWRHF